MCFLVLDPGIRPGKVPARPGWSGFVAGQAARTNKTKVVLIYEPAKPVDCSCAAGFGPFENIGNYAYF
jgi:hypothetical protein